MYASRISLLIFSNESPVKDWLENLESTVGDQVIQLYIIFLTLKHVGIMKQILCVNDLYIHCNK